MSKKIELPEQEIIDTYKTNVWWTLNRLAKKYDTTVYRIRKILVAANCLRQTAELEKLLIKNFLKYERQFDPKTSALEMFNARKLIADYPDEEFWTNLDIGFKLNSLAFFQSPKGQEILKRKYAESKFELPVAPQHNISNTKVGDDVTVIQKPKSIHEFLKR